MSYRCNVVIGGTHGVRLLTKLSMCMSRGRFFCGTHMESWFCLFVESNGQQLGRVWCIWSQLVMLHLFYVVGCPPGVERQALHTQVHRLLLHVPWLHRRKRDCTPTLFLTSSVCTSSLTLCTNGGGRIGTSPFLLSMSRSSPEEEGLALLLILPVCTSEGEGQAFSLTTTATNLGGGGTGLLLTMSVSSSEVQSWHGWDASAIPSVWVGMGQLHRWDVPAIPSVWVGMGQLRRWGRSSDTMVCGLQRLARCCRSVPLGDALRYHAMVCVADHGSVSDRVVDGRVASAVLSVFDAHPEVGLYTGGERQMLGRWRSDNSWSDRLEVVRVQTWMLGSTSST